MFEASDFELPLEKQLRIHQIKAEVTECTDAKVLQEHLIQCATSLMKYQHLLAKTLERQITADLEKFEKAFKIVEETNKEK